VQTVFKNLSENNLITSRLVNMRRAYGLPPHQGGRLSYNVWRDHVKKDLPVIVPIPEDLFGGKPKDWHSKAKFTDLIFMGGGNSQLNAETAAFLVQARAANVKVVVLAFSSMPVPRSLIYECAIKIATKVQSGLKVVDGKVVGSSGADSKGDKGKGTEGEVGGGRVHSPPRVIMLVGGANQVRWLISKSAR
jgi:hypothetical protein